ncbi:MAG: methyltransferase domain-containing protein, partial [Patescibacteria group bacterium]
MKVDRYRKGEISQGDLTGSVRGHYEAKRNDRNLELSAGSGLVHHHFGIGELPGSIESIQGFEIQDVLSQLESNQTDILIDAMGGVKSSDLVLDAGCGRGGTSFMIAEQTGASVRGITISPYQAGFAARVAQDKFPNLKTSFSVMNMLNTALSDQ